jgi:cell division protein FtsW (lipid II flippase)
LISYGSNSMVVMCIMLALVLRAAKETRMLSSRGRANHE